MKSSITTEVQIQASPIEVWKVLTNFSDYPKWNPFISSITGDVKTGNRIKAVIGNMKFKPKVLAYESPSIFKWKGKILFPGIFDGEHSFTLKENNDGSTTLIQSENFSGILVFIFNKKMLNETQEGFIQMNNALKKEVEQKLV